MVDTWILTDGSCIANECVWKDAPSNKTRFVTHADYKALEEENAVLKGALAGARAANREDYIDSLEAELASLRARVGELVKSSNDACEVLRQAMTNTSIPVYRAANAISRVCEASEALQ